MSFHISTGSQFTSELINFLKPKDLTSTQLPSGDNFGDYLYWDGNAYVVGDSEVKFGANAGKFDQGNVSVAIGSSAGNQNQGPSCVAIGVRAGKLNQGTGATGSYSCCAIAVGSGAGSENQGIYSVAIGPAAGELNQSPASIAVGFRAGQESQGSDAIAIGNGAGQNSQANQSIVINATGSVVDNTVSGTCKITPLRDINPSELSFTEPYVMSYSPSTAEVTYNSNPQIQRNFGQGNELLLSDYNTVHYYMYNGDPIQNFDISTNMVENAVYEVTFNMSSSMASNNDVVFLPNYIGASHLYTNYTQRTDAGSYQGNYANGSGFNFDLTVGSNGFDPVGKFTIFNNRNAKKIRSEIGDTFAALSGCGYWLTSDTNPTSGTPLSYDTSTQWLTVGRISISPATFTNAFVSVKRIA